MKSLYKQNIAARAITTWLALIHDIRGLTSRSRRRSVTEATLKLARSFPVGSTSRRRMPTMPSRRSWSDQRLALVKGGVRHG